MMFVYILNIIAI